MVKLPSAAISSTIGGAAAVASLRSLCGSWTSMVLRSMGCAIMNIASSTSSTSIIGVMLMSDMLDDFFPFPTSKAIYLLR
jgi:hypothetical protein